MIVEVLVGIVFVVAVFMIFIKTENWEKIIKKEKI